MSRREPHTIAQTYQGMKRSTRLSIIAGVAVFLTLVSGVSFAAWTASSTKTATASAGAVAVSTEGTVAALGLYTYSLTNTSITKAVTVRNTGSVSASVANIAITRTGTLGDDQIWVTFWAGTSSACAATTPVVKVRLNNGSSANLSTLNMTVAASSSAILCASTTFDGSLVTQAGRTANATFGLTSRAGTNWTAFDSMAVANRSFSQSIVVNTAPGAPTVKSCVNQTDSNNRILISWNAPSGPVPVVSSYNIYFTQVVDSVSTTALIGNTTSTSALVSNVGSDSGIAFVTKAENSSSGANVGTLTVRSISATGAESSTSAAFTVKERNGNSGLACG